MLVSSMRITLALSPQDSLRSFHLSEDFHVERFAAEPQVVDPVEMVVDDNGRIYVAEMIDHPDDPPPGTPERSRIRLLEDTDGDGKADIRQLLYTGFPKSNPESPITNPRLGIDNWVYCANTGPDGLIISPHHRERPPIQIRGGDFRFHPIRGVAEPASGPTQFGLTFDNWGNRFSTQNTIHLRRVAADAVI
jgi:hypothetical protein